MDSTFFQVGSSPHEASTGTFSHDEWAKVDNHARALLAQFGYHGFRLHCLATATHLPEQRLREPFPNEEIAATICCDRLLKEWEEEIRVCQEEKTDRSKLWQRYQRLFCDYLFPDYKPYQALWFELTKERREHALPSSLANVSQRLDDTWYRWLTLLAPRDWSKKERNHRLNHYLAQGQWHHDDWKNERSREHLEQWFQFIASTW